MKKKYDIYEINLISMVFYVLRKYKRMLKISLVIALLFGCYGVAKTYVSNTKKVITEEQQIEYDLKLKEFDQRIADCGKAISDYQTKVSNSETYKTESIMYNIDPKNTFTYEKYYFVDTYYRILPNMDYQNVNYTNTVGNLYISFTKSNDVLQQISNDLSIKADYLSEIYSLTYGDGIITLRIYGNDEAECGIVISTFEKYFASIGKDIKNSLVNHELEVLTEKKCYCECAYVKNYIENKNQEFSSYATAIADNNKAIETIKTEKESYIASFNEKYVKQSLVSPAIKYSIIGLIIGILGAACGYCLIFIFRDKVNNSKDLEDKLNCEIISRLSKRGKEDKILSLISKWECRTEENDLSNCCRLSLNNIAGNEIEAKTILVTGNIDDDTMKKFADKFAEIDSKRKWVVGKDILNNYETSALLNSADYVIVIAESDVSSYCETWDEIERINSIGKKAGCIVIE